MANNSKLDLKKAYEDFGYRLIDAFGTLYAAFEECTINPNCLKDNDFTGPWTDEFNKIAKDNINPPFVTIDGFLELTCSAKDGITKIKEALISAGNVKKDDNSQINIQYVSAPKYRITVNAMDYKIAEDLLRNAADLAIESIKKHDGHGVFHRKET
jgi:translation initiation factor 2 subunit 1